MAGALGFTFARCSDLYTRTEKWVVWDRERAQARLHLPLFILLGVYTGARKEAILSLRWSQVDLSAGRLDYNGPGVRRTNKRRSRIPVPAKLLGHLRRASKRGTSNVEKAKKEQPKSATIKDAVFSFVIGYDGERLGDVKRGFASACRRAGLDGVSPHVLRHTCATWLMQRGVPMWEAAGFLGMSRETLERVYGHHSPDYLKSAAEAFA